MNRKPYKRQKRGVGRHVQLPEWLQATEAWASLSPGPRALYIELKRRYNGRNNGEIYLSHRDAAEAICVHRNTVGGYFEELQERGFIRMTQPPHLGPSGIGQASVWELDEVPGRDGSPAKKAFVHWTKNKTPAQNLGQGVTNIVPLSASKNSRSA